jgi:drug/metabolite transporter (DMT)-like permease
MGIGAALAWGIHDVLVRRLSQGAAVLPLLAAALLAGALANLPLSLAFGDWSAMTGRALAAAAAAGLLYALGGLGLWKAFGLAPLRIVAPVVGAYPMLSLFLGWLRGEAVTPLDAAAVLLIAAGIAWVALRSSAGEAVAPAIRRLALLWAALGAVGFACTFALGHVAAEAGDEFPAIFVTRVLAVLSILALILVLRPSAAGIRPNLPLLMLLGLLDAVALGLVLSAGALPEASYAAVASSLFGVVAILLAWRFLGEHVSLPQWLGIGVVFTGVAMLAA